MATESLPAGPPAERRPASRGHPNGRSAPLSRLARLLLLAGLLLSACAPPGGGASDLPGPGGASAAPKTLTVATTVEPFDEAGFRVEADLRDRVLRRSGRPCAERGEAANVVLIGLDASANPVATLRHWKGLIAPNGGIWLLTPKRGKPGYVDQNQLITAGQAAGVVDNKVCSVSDDLSAMRFVIRRADRQL